MKSANQIYKEIKPEQSFKDWVNSEKLLHTNYVYQCQNKNIDFIDFDTYLHSKFIDKKHFNIESNNNTETNKSNSRIAKINEFVVGMPPYITWGLGALLLTAVTLTAYHIIKKNENNK